MVCLREEHNRVNWKGGRERRNRKGTTISKENLGRISPYGRIHEHISRQKTASDPQKKR